MSFVVYFFVLLIAVGGVLFGLDWVSAPMSPMPASKFELHAAKPPPPRIETPPEPAVAAKPATVEPPPVAEPPPAPVVAPEPAVAAAPPPKCDIDACTAAYRSFTASDCTYQPLDGPRRLCTRGTPPAAAVTATPSAASGPDARAQAACNIAACSQAYVSFTASDCTYQPLTGPRKLCEK